MTQLLARGVVRVFRLTDEPGGLGLSCTPAGVSLAGVPLLRKTRAGFEPRPASEIASLLRAAYGEDPTSLRSRLGAIANALNSGDFATAMIAAVHTRTPELTPGAALQLAKADRALAKYNYNPDEPRDWRGRWTRDGSATPPNVAAPGIRNDQGADQYAPDQRRRFAENASTAATDATTSSQADSGDTADGPASLKQTFERKYDDLGPVDLSRQVIAFGDWLDRSAGNLPPDKKARALAEYSFLQNRLSFWLDDDSNSITVNGNLISAAWTLYQGAINGGIVPFGHFPRSILSVAGLVALLSDSAPHRPYKAPPLEEVPVAAAQVPKDVERLGGIGEAGKPVQITLRGIDYTLPDWHMQEISYTKRTAEAVKALRAEFTPLREAFVKDLVENHAAELRDSGVSDDGLARMANGQVPNGYQVHHVLSLDDGGTNATSNLVLMRQDPDHALITNYQNEQTRGMSAGQTRRLGWPMPDSRVRVWPEMPGGGAYPSVHKLGWLTADSRMRIWPKILHGSRLRPVLTRRTSMSDIYALLAAIDSRERKFAGALEPPASPEAIEGLRAFAWDTFRTDLAEGYVTFLRRHDGLVFNGHVIYAATENKKRYTMGFIEVNEGLGEGDDRFVFYGEDDITLYAQDRRSRAWVALDRPSLDVMDTFPSFDAMLAKILRQSLEWLTGALSIDKGR